MAGPAAPPAAAVFVGGAAVRAGWIWLRTPVGQRTAATLGGAMAAGATDAVGTIRDYFSDDDTAAPAVPQTDTGTQQRQCDGPHNGRLQVQGYRHRVDPFPIELSWPWNRPCTPPLRPEGLGALSGILLPETMAIRRESAFLRGPAFASMSRFISNSSPLGFTPADSGGWSITSTGTVVRNRSRGAGPNAPRVDIDIFAGRAFGDS